MIFEPTITKEKINVLPICTFTGNIIVVTSKEQLEDSIQELKKETILGFDTETKPSFAKGVINKVALMQIATENTCYLFRLNKIGLPMELERLLKNKKIKKIGLSLRDDFSALNKRKVFCPESFIDLQKIVANYGISDLSLQKIYAILFGEKISKSQRLSNWEAETLSEAQQHYAALDAWATRRIYLKLMEMPTVPETKNLPIN
ncbi:MAG: 3'-5' exonuclease domain-containing protein 2 [Paludibacteraceae bacterium]|nr:3'-5' exonuclease domain-containing protein 2 [Paludibacteraceae bacterium]